MATTKHLRVLLWDVDGTAVTMPVGKADKHRTAVAAVLDIDLTGYSAWAGMTDGQIVTELAMEAGVQLDEFQFRRTLSLLNELTVREMKATAATPVRGINLALAAVHDCGWRSGLLTGNTPQRAWAKLASADLARMFDWNLGYFGDDSRDRNSLAKAAIADLVSRGHVHGAVEGSVRDDIVIVGDTPRDIAAAHAAGVSVIALATGHYSAAELASCSPTLVLENLETGLAEFKDFLLATGEKL